MAAFLDGPLHVTTIVTYKLEGGSNAIFPMRPIAWSLFTSYSFLQTLTLPLQAFCEVETGVTSAEIGLLFNGIPLLDLKKSLKEYGVKDGDMVMMEQIRRRSQPQPAAAGAGGMNWDFSRIQVPSGGAAGGAED